MKKLMILFIAGITAFSYAGAQNRIDTKYKNPGSANTKEKITAIEKIKLVDSLSLLHPEKLKGDYQKMIDKYYSELQAFNNSGKEIWIYEDEYFNGAKKVLQVGNFTLKDLGLFWNDKISSVLIPSSLKVEVFLNDNYQGSSTFLFGWGLPSVQHSSNNSWIGARPSIGSYNGSISAFRDVSGKIIAELNDNISSIKISTNANCCKP